MWEIQECGLNPGSKAYPGGFAPAAAVAETFTNGCGAVCERERYLPNIPPEPEVVPTGRVLRSWSIK